MNKTMKNKILLFGFVVALFLIPAIAYSADGNPADVPTGVIVSNGPDCTLNFKNSGGIAGGTVTANTVTTTVTSEYGFIALSDMPTASIEPSATRSISYPITNEGNNSDKYDITIVTAYGGGTDGTGWYVSLESGGVPKVKIVGDGTIMTIESTSLGEDGTYPLEVVVHPSTSAPDKSWVLVTLNVTTDAKPAGVYLGANGNTYGGVYNSTDTTYTIISSAIMSMTKTASVDAPTQYIANGGGAHDAVPGSVITYTIVVTNDGAGVANNVVVVDKVPYGTGDQISTEAAHIGMSKDSDGLDNVVLTSLPAYSGSAWRAYTTTEAASGARLEYGAVNWTSLEGIDPPPTYLVGSSAAYVKWEIGTLAGKTTTVLTWGVVIK